MFEVRSAIHVRTGQRASVEAVDAWLAQHGVETVAFDDPYDACVHLLRQYEQIPDLALIGTDWLAEDEANIIAYVRQTWSRAVVVVYGATQETPRFDVLPLTRTCRGEAALRRILAEPPADLVRRMYAQVAPLRLAPSPPAVARAVAADAPAGRLPNKEGPDKTPRTSPERLGLNLSATEPPRCILTAEELAALLDPAEEQ